MSNGIVEQAWEMGEKQINLIHGHGRNRGISVGFTNTNTWYFGLKVRSDLRSSEELRQWIKYTTLDCSDPGVTSVKLKNNPSPFRTALGSGFYKSEPSAVRIGLGLFFNLTLVTPGSLQSNVVYLIHCRSSSLDRRSERTFRPKYQVLVLVNPTEMPLFRPCP